MSGGRGCYRARMTSPANGRLLARAGALILASVALAATAALPAVAADNPPSTQRYERVQKSVDYTVYAPETSFGLPRTGFQKFGCGSGRDSAISVSYGSQAQLTNPWIGLNESPGKTGCTDGPDGVGPVTTFRANGIKATVYGACAKGASTCVTSTPALAARQAYTVITLPGSAARPTPTFTEVYTQALTLAQIKEFVRGLFPAA